MIKFYDTSLSMKGLLFILVYHILYIITTCTTCMVFEVKVVCKHKIYYCIIRISMIIQIFVEVSLF